MAHLLAFLVALVGFGVATATARHPALRRLGLAYIGTAVTGLIAVAAVALSGHTPRFIGGAERLLVLIAVAWIALRIRVESGDARSSQS